MKVEQIQQKEVCDTPDFREARRDNVGVKVPFFEMIESGHEPVRDEEHEPEDEAVEAAAAAPEGFVLVVGEEHGQGHDEDQCDEADVRLRELRLQDVPLQILFQFRREGSAVISFIRNQVEDTQYQKDDSVDEGRDPVELEAKIEDVEVLVMGCEGEYAEVEQHVDGHQGAGDAVEVLRNSGFLLLTHGEAPLCN